MQRLSCLGIPLLILSDYTRAAPRRRPPRTPPPRTIPGAESHSRILLKLSRPAQTSWLSHPPRAAQRAAERGHEGGRAASTSTSTQRQSACDLADVAGCGRAAATPRRVPRARTPRTLRSVACAEARRSSGPCPAIARRRGRPSACRTPCEPPRLQRPLRSLRAEALRLPRGCCRLRRRRA